MLKSMQFFSSCEDGRNNIVDVMRAQKDAHTQQDLRVVEIVKQS
jgi:hypothetical protein